MTIVATILFVFAITFVFFRAFGPRADFLFPTRAQKEKWDSDLGIVLGKWVTITNIFGTITSFATVLFLMGSVKLFGFFSLVTGLSIVAGAFVTNYFTVRLLSNERISNRLKQSDQTSGVIALLLWSETSSGKTLSFMTKWVSIVSIAAIIWLEVSLFTDFTVTALGIQKDQILFRSIGVFVVSFAINFFVLRYGIRGFTFADFLHGPLIAFSAILLSLGVLLAFSGVKAPWSDLAFITPQLSWAQCVVFALHVCVLNCLQVLCTEPHWLRIWLLGDRENKNQVLAMAFTGFFWFVMLFIGLSASAYSGSIGEDAISALIEKLSSLSQVFVAVFWVAVTAALFSTADTQAYCLLLVWKFDPKTGELNNIRDADFTPFKTAILASFVACIVYFFVRFANLPLEKIIFVVIPSVVTLAPSLILKSLGYSPQPSVLVASILGYVGIAILGFVRPETEFVATLSAVFVPLIVVLIALAILKFQKNERRA